MANKYKNIVGTAFAPYVKTQLKQRSDLGLNSFKNKTPRTSKELQYFTNRNAWFRLSSSSEITSRSIPSQQTAKTNDFAFLASDIAANNLAETQVNIENAENLRIYNESFTGDLAKDNVLQGGIVISGDKNSTTLRKGFKQTYAEGDFDNLGLQPMPGITGITIGTGGKWQTLMQADIEFICYNLDQLDIMSKLYMSLGVTCFLEWGHLPYLDNSGNLVNNTTNIDFFGENDKLNLIKSITKKRKDTFGNYDAFLGTVYNFSYQADKDGAYLCKTQLMGAGGMVESLKINTSFNIDFANTTETNDAVNFNCTLDNALFAMSEFLKGTGDKRIYKTEKRTESSFFGGEYEVANNFGKVTSDIWFKDMTYKPPKYTPPKGTILNRTWGGLLNQVYDSATYSPFTFIPEGNKGTVQYRNTEALFGNAHQYLTDLSPEGLKEVDIEFYSGYAGQWTGGGFFEFLGSGKEQVMTYITFGHLLALVQNLGIFTESKSESVDRKNSKPILYIDYHPDNTIINLAPITATINPYKVLVPFIENTSYSDFFENLNITATAKYSWSSAPEDKGLASHNLSSPNVQNRVNKVLPESSFLNREGVFGGKLMNVLINIDFARDSLRSTKDSDNNVNLIEYVSKILEGINQSLGGVNNLRPFIDECGTILRIIDEKAPNYSFIKEDLLEIPTFGLGSVAYNASYQSAITPKLASQIVIATQAAGGQGIKDFSEDVLSYQSLNANVKDRFSTYKYPSIVKPTSAADLAKEEAKYVRSLLKLYDTLWGIYTTSQSPTITKDVVTNMLSPWIDLSNQCSKKEYDTDTQKLKNKSSVLIPLEYDITMDGIAGILPYNAFLIPDNRLPERYRGRVAFAVFSINHAFDDNNWTTTLRGQTLLLDTPRTLTKAPIIPATRQISPNPPNNNNLTDFPNITQTGYTTTPSLDDSPRGQVTTVNNITPSGIVPITPFGSPTETPTQTVGTVTTGPDGLQSVSFNPVPTDQDINAAFDFISYQETPGGVPELRAYEDKDYTVSAGFTLRIGFGSDTITNTDGTVTGVIRSSRITKEQAILDLQRRIKNEFKPKVVRRLTERGVNYDSLPLKVKVVFIDLAYNYGTLFYDFITAYKSGGVQGIIGELNRRIARGPGQVPTRRQAEINYLKG